MENVLDNILEHLIGDGKGIRGRSVNESSITIYLNLRSKFRELENKLSDCDFRAKYFSGLDIYIKEMDLVEDILDLHPSLKRSSSFFPAQKKIKKEKVHENNNSTEGQSSSLMDILIGNDIIKESDDSVIIKDFPEEPEYLTDDGVAISDLKSDTISKDLLSTVDESKENFDEDFIKDNEEAIKASNEMSLEDQVKVIVNSNDDKDAKEENLTKKKKTTRTRRNRRKKTE